MKFGWPISLVLHGIFVLGGLVVFASGIEAYEETKIIPIEMLTISEYDNIRASVKKKPDVEPVPDVPMELETPLENAQAEDAPKDTVQEPEESAPAQAIPEEKTAEVTKPKAPEKPAFDLESMSALVDKARAAQPEADQQKTLQSEENFYAYAENARQAVGAGTDLTVNEITALKSAMYRCWRIPLDAKNPEELVVSVRVKLRGDGVVQSADLVDPGAIRRSSNPYMAVAAQRAVNAVTKCAPYDFLPPDKYDTWKDMVLRFKPEI